MIDLFIQPGVFKLRYANTQAHIHYTHPYARTHAVAVRLTHKRTLLPCHVSIIDQPMTVNFFTTN